MVHNLGGEYYIGIFDGPQSISTNGLIERDQIKSMSLKDPTKHFRHIRHTSDAPECSYRNSKQWQMIDIVVLADLILCL